MPLQAVLPADADQLRGLKARYFSFVDLKQWSDLRALFTDDCVFEGLWAAAPTPEEFVRNIANNLTSDVVSVHYGYTPRFAAIDNDSVRGVWAMSDYLTWPAGERGYMGVTLPGQSGMRGYGHYEETYQRTESGWKFRFMRLTRIRIDPIIGEAPAVQYPFIASAPGWIP